MKNFTCATINKALNEKGIQMRIKRGNGYFYWIDQTKDGMRGCDDSIYTCHLTSPFEWYISEALRISKQDWTGR